MHAVAGTPAEVLGKLNREIVRALNMPDVKQRLRALGSDGAPGTPEQLNQFVKLELAKYARVVKDAAIKIE